MCKGVNVLWVLFSLTAFAEQRAEIVDRDRGSISFEIDKSGQILTTPHPNPQKFPRRFWQPDPRPTRLILTRNVNGVSSPESVVLGPLRALELFTVGDRVFVIVREEKKLLTGPSYLQELRARIGRGLKLSDFYLPAGLGVGMAYAVYMLPPDVPDYVIPVTTVGYTALGVGWFIVDTLSHLRNVDAKTGLVHRGKALARVDDVVRDGERVVDILYSPSTEPPPIESRSLRDATTSTCASLL